MFLKIKKMSPSKSFNVKSVTVSDINGYNKKCFHESEETDRFYQRFCDGDKDLFWFTFFTLNNAWREDSGVEKINHEEMKIEIELKTGATITITKGENGYNVFKV